MTKGERIRQARKSANYTIIAAARALEIPLSRMQMYERDETQISPVIIGKMARLFGVSASELCDDDGVFLRLPVKLCKNALAPGKKRSGAGFELYARSSAFLNAGASMTLDTGIYLELPQGYYAAVVSSPALIQRFGIFADGLLEGGENTLKLTLTNLGKCGYLWQAGDKIAELYIMPCALTELERL